MKKIFSLFLSCLISLIISGCDAAVYENEEKNKSAICRSNQALIQLTSNGRSTNVEEKRHSENTYFSDTICESIKKVAYSYDKNADVVCEEQEFYANYVRKETIENIVNSYGDTYQCIIYGDDKEEFQDIIVGSWCLEFDNNGDKNIYKYTYNKDGSFSKYQEFGENGEYKINTKGVYTFDGNIVRAISLFDDGSSYDEYISYNNEDGTLKNSNIRSEFPNILTKCD